MTKWSPKTKVEDKLKTGDVEQLAMVWTAYQAIARGEQVVGSNVDEARKKWSKTNLEGLDVGLLAIETKIKGGTKKHYAFTESNHEYLPDGTPNPKLSNYKQLWTIQTMVKAIQSALDRVGQLFVVNLVMFDFRTVPGGRVRKSTSVLRRGSDLYYSRPFEDKLPLYADLLLSALDQVEIGAKKSACVSLDGKGSYLPPTRFTATFPLILEGAKDDPKLLSNPSLSDKPRSSPVKYAFLPSFGFAEPGYCTWKDHDRSESAGTRLSLGAYSLDANYTLQIMSLWKRLETRNRDLYSRYGSVSRIHLLTLYKKFSGGRGQKLAILWVFQMVDIARALADAVVLHSQTNKKTLPLRGFFDFVHTKIDIREAKIWQIQEQGIGSNTNLFEYLWVFESTLWELAMLGASCLSLEQMALALGKTVSGWTPTVGLSELALSEKVKVGKDFALERHYFPSGTAAADELYEALWSLEFRPVAVVADPKNLSTFTPYFEFYQPAGALLDPEQIKKKSGYGALQHTQLWINLSDSLHAFIINHVSDDVGTTLGALVAEHLAGQIKPAQGQIALVVDYTKLAGDMPNDRLYPILLSFRSEVLRRISSVTLELVFFRSNLKYNTGSLDRYQAGEVLTPIDGKSKSMVPKSLAGKLHSASNQAFTGSDFDGSSGWQLNGAYVPLMKRTYLLADAVGFGRWKPYAALWGKGTQTSLRTKSTGDEKILDDTMVLSQWFVSFVHWPLAPIFTNLIKDLTKANYSKYLPPSERERIRTTWKQICADAELLAKSNAYKQLSWRESGLLLRPMRKVAAYLKPELLKIVSGMAKNLTGKKVGRLDKSKALANMRSYRSRLQEASMKVANMDVLIAKTVKSTFDKHSDNDTVDMNGAHCFTCDRVHGRFRSLIRRWHVCDVCRTVYCYACGYSLPYYEFEGLDEVLDAMASYNPGVRACGRCDGPTALA